MYIEDRLSAATADRLANVRARLERQQQKLLELTVEQRVYERPVLSELTERSGELLAEKSQSEQVHTHIVHVTRTHIYSFHMHICT